MTEYLYFTGALIALSTAALQLAGLVPASARLRMSLLWGTIVMAICVCGAIAGTAAAGEAITPWMKVIDSTEIPMIIYDDRVQVAYANEAALKFYSIDLESIKSKEPQQLHAWAQPYMLNFKDWAAEQVARNTAARNGTLNSKSTVPMHMSKNHPFGDQYWYLSSKPLTVDKKRYLLTTFIGKPVPE